MMLPGENQNGVRYRLDAHDKRLEKVEEKVDVARDALTRLEAEAKSQAAALRLQAAEYQRRLADLNHEAARIQGAAELSVSEEKFDAHVQRFEEYKETTSSALRLKEGRERGQAAILGITNQGLLTLVAIVSAVVLLVRYVG